MIATTKYRDQLLAELDVLPDEYLPFVFQIMRSFRESIALKPAVASFSQGWHEVQLGETYPVESLWDDINAE